MKPSKIWVKPSKMWVKLEIVKWDMRTIPLEIFFAILPPKHLNLFWFSYFEFWNWSKLRKWAKLRIINKKRFRKLFFEAKSEIYFLYFKLFFSQKYKRNLLLWYRYLAFDKMWLFESNSKEINHFFTLWDCTDLLFDLLFHLISDRILGGKSAIFKK